MSVRHGVQVARVRRGRWLAGVAQGIAAFRGIAVGWVRSGFVLGALCGGVGLAVYIACWLILPERAAAAATGGTEGGAPAAADDAGEDAAMSGPVVLARALGVAIAAATLAAASLLISVFGWGWLALVLAGAIALAMYIPPLRVSATLGLVAVAALALPSLGVSATQVSLAPQTGRLVVAPAGPRALAAQTYRSGLGPMLIDLRHSRWPAAGTVQLTIAAGIRRTIVALPHDRCVRVRIHYVEHPLLADLALLVTQRVAGPTRGVVLFNRIYDTGATTLSLASAARAGVGGPTLDIDFRSQGGSLQVRDYPDRIDPDTDPDWPGLTVPIDPRPVEAFGLTRRGFVAELAYWRRRVPQERRWQRQLDALLPGPCGS